MMRKISRLLQSFATLDFPLRSSYIQQAFVATHKSYCKEYEGWSVNATRKKVIADYWIKHVLIHFAALYLTAIFIALAFSSNFIQFTFPGFFYLINVAENH